MLHHKHPGLAGRLAADGRTLEPHPDALRDDARQVWIPLPDAAGREVDALEGLLCVPTREGAARVVAVPHVASHLALGDELAIADWDGEPLARGELASSLHATVRVVVGPERTWQDIASALERACWFDVMGAHAVAVAVPRMLLAATFETLDRLTGELGARWEYATPARHS